MNPAYRDAIASIESMGSGGYAAVGPKVKGGDRAYGRYQVMGSNIPAWTKAALGKSMTPEQFLKDPAAQDAVFDHRFGSYVEKYGPEKAARAWFGGPGAINNPKAKDVLGTNVASYGAKFMAALGNQPATGTALIPAAQAVANPAATMDALFKPAAPAVPSYAAQLAEIQNQPAPEEPGGAKWGDMMLAGAVEDDATRARSNAIAAFFDEPAIPELAVPQSIDDAISQYLAKLS